MLYLSLRADYNILAIHCNIPATNKPGITATTAGVLRHPTPDGDTHDSGTGTPGNCGQGAAVS